MVLLRRLYARLHLMVNEVESGVAFVLTRRLFGYAFWVGPGVAVGSPTTRAERVSTA
jgi:hypothetical protein